MSEKETHEATDTQEEKVEKQEEATEESTGTDTSSDLQSESKEEADETASEEEESEEIDEVEALQLLLAEKEAKIVNLEGLSAIAQKNIKTLEKQVSDLHKKLHDINNAYIKEKEDLAAYQDRFQRQMENRETRRRGEVVKILFEPLENLRRSHASIEKNDPDMAVGIGMVIKAFMKGFTDLGLEEITPDGQKFNPNEHNALMMQPTPDPALDEVVLQTYSVGYRIEGLVLQAAQVIVGKYDGPPIENSSDDVEQEGSEAEQEEDADVVSESDVQESSSND